MIVYHSTAEKIAAVILENGFIDGEGNYLTTNWYTGVWISDSPLDENEGCKGGATIAVEIPPDVLAPYEWIQEGWSYREWLIPAGLLNRYPRRLLSDEEWDAAMPPLTEISKDEWELQKKEFDWVNDYVCPGK